MDDQFNFWLELHRRRVFRTTAAYAAIAYVAVELIAGLVLFYEWPSFVVQGAVVAALLGGIVVAVVSWVYDITPWGIFRTPRHGELPRRKTGLLDYRVEVIVIIVLLVALGIAIRGTFQEFTELRRQELGSDVGAVQSEQNERFTAS